MVDGAEVLCSKSKFYTETYYTRLCGVYEEACVLAIERSLVPFPGRLTPEQAFELALIKVCTSITSGWFREFAWEHHDVVMDMARNRKFDYFSRFQTALVDGKIQHFTGNKYAA
jgi:hypothetical protein